MKNDNSRKIKMLAVRKQPIALYQVLKLENLVQSGGEGKMVIAEGLVRVNGEVETRKGRKIVSGDVIEFEGNRIRIAGVPVR